MKQLNKINYFILFTRVGYAPFMAASSDDQDKYFCVWNICVKDYRKGTT